MKKGKPMLLSKCVGCDSKKSRFIKEQEASGLLSSLEIRTGLDKISMLGPLLFKRYKTNEIINKFLLSEHKFVTEMDLRQLVFTYSACVQFIKNKERMQKFRKTGDWKYIYQNQLDKVYFEQDMANGDFKVLPRKIASDKVLCDKAFNIARNPSYDGYQRALASIPCKFLIKNLLVMVLKANLCQTMRL